jgi:hypothetical protein
LRLVFRPILLTNTHILKMVILETHNNVYMGPHKNPNNADSAA